MSSLHPRETARLVLAPDSYMWITSRCLPELEEEIEAAAANGGAALSAWLAATVAHATAASRPTSHRRVGSWARALTAEELAEGLARARAFAGA